MLSIKTPSTSSPNKTQRGSVLFISLVILVALGFLFASFHQSQKSFSLFHSKLRFDSQKEALIRSAHRLVIKKLQLNPFWLTENYTHNFQKDLSISLKVEPWGLAKKISVLKVQVKGQIDSTHMPIWYHFDQRPADEFVTLTLTDYTSKLTLGGEGLFRGSLSAMDTKLDLSNRYQVRYRSKEKSVALGRPWKLQGERVHPDKWLPHIQFSQSHILLDSESRVRDSLIQAESVVVSSGARFKNSIIIADTLTVRGDFDYLNAQFFGLKKLYVQATQKDSLNSIEGNPIFVSINRNSDSGTTKIKSWIGKAHFYHIDLTPAPQKSHVQFDSLVNGIGLIYSNVPIQFQGTWRGAITTSSLDYYTAGTTWKNLLYNGKIMAFEDDYLLENIIAPRVIHE